MAKPVAPAKEEKKPGGDESSPLWTGTARFADRYYEMGIVGGIGSGLLFANGAEGVGITGIRVLEHHGYISKIFIAALVAMGQSDKKYVGSTYGTYSTGYATYAVRTDYYRSLTPAEQEANRQQVADAANGQYTTEVTVYTPRLFGLNLGNTQASGFEASLGGDVVLGFIGPLPSILTIGGWGAYLNAPARWKGAPPPQQAGQPTPQRSYPAELSYQGFGVFLRAHVPVTRFADISAEWDLNVLTLFHTGAEERETSGDLYQSPFKLGAYIHLTDRAYVQGKATFGGFGIADGKLGTQAEFGIRF